MLKQGAVSANKKRVRSNRIYARIRADFESEEIFATQDAYQVQNRIED
jgi:hypothetical protein